MTKPPRVSRLLEIVSLVQGGQGWTAGALAKHFGVSLTRVFNDIRALRAAGVPIHSSRAGYRIDSSYFLPALRLSPQEVVALLFPEGALLGAERTQEVLQSARCKLLACLPGPLRASAEEWLARTNVLVPVGRMNPAVFAEVREAVAERRRIVIIYSGRTSTTLRRLEVDPYGVAFRKHAWYLVGYSVTHREVRKFRISRIEAVERTPLHFTVPKDFSLDAVFEGSWYVFGGEPQEIGIHFSPFVSRLVREQMPHPGQTFQTFSDGSTFYRARVRNLDEVAWWLVQYGAEAVVVYPKALRDKVIAIAQGVLRANGAAAARLPNLYTQAPADAAERAGEPERRAPSRPQA